MNYVYIMTNFSNTVLYVGITNNLIRRVYEHKTGTVGGFTSKYRVKKLVYYENTNNVSIAISREKQIKGWKRDRKIKLIENMNPLWTDLSKEWYEF